VVDDLLGSDGTGEPREPRAAATAAVAVADVAGTYLGPGGARVDKLGGGVRPRGRARSTEGGRRTATTAGEPATPLWTREMGWPCATSA